MAAAQQRRQTSRTRPEPRTRPESDTDRGHGRSTPLSGFPPQPGSDKKKREYGKRLMPTRDLTRTACCPHGKENIVKYLKHK